MKEFEDILTDPAFAGLHWSIPSDTPWEEREAAHVHAAYLAKWTRDASLKPPSLSYLSSHAGPYDVQNRFWLCCNKTDLAIHAERLRCPNI